MAPRLDSQQACRGRRSGGGAVPASRGLCQPPPAVRHLDPQRCRCQPPTRMPLSPRRPGTPSRQLCFQAPTRLV